MTIDDQIAHVISQLDRDPAIRPDLAQLIYRQSLRLSMALEFIREMDSKFVPDHLSRAARECLERLER